eukprot:scaffold102680_cov77-Cyclotella_meneghiniana.AAC.7
MDLVKSRGFVDGVLFAKSQLLLPEVFTLDAENVSHIRNETRCCVIASALVLHACKISRAPTSILSSEFVPEERHSQQELLEASVVDATNDLAIALGNTQELDSNETEGLRNHVLAVMQGSNPVLKLLDNRIRSFFCFACKWKPNTTLKTPQPPMKTGRSILKGEGVNLMKNNMIPSTKKEFTAAAQKEASRLGFAFFKSELGDLGDTSRRIIALACDIYGKDVLGRMLSESGQE